MARGPAEPICPECGLRVRVPPEEGQSCDDCRSAAAWHRYGATNRRLVVTAASIAELEARRARAEAPLPWWRSAPPVACAATAAACAVAATVLIVSLVAPRPLGPFAEFLAAWRTDARACAALGLLAAAVGVAATAYLRRTALFRRWIAIAPCGAAAAAGLLCASFGAVHWWMSENAWTMKLSSAPPVPASPASPLVERVMRATVVLFAPGADGDARGGALGAGSVVRSDPGCAWIITCSHVAMPYASASALRDPAAARTVWVHLADGRNGPGRVRWTAPPPIDVALVSMDVDHPPDPVEVAQDDRDIAEGAPVLFVPNPLRLGWLVHRGAATRRESRTTAAGEFALIYTDLPVMHGDSGSGLFDDRGRLVGLNTWATVENAKPAGICLPSATLAGAFDTVTEEPPRETESPK